MPYLLSLILLFSLPAQAVIQKFGANEHNSVWNIEGDNKFRCSLKQTIPNFGEATFRHMAGDKLRLEVDLIHPNRAEREVEFISRPPLWQHKRGARLLDSLQLNEPSTRVRFGSQQARVALTELEQGLFPTLRYRVAKDGNREINAAISSVNFQPSYHKFLTCLSQLMPYQFDYVEESAFYFRPGRSTLSALDKRRLNEVITYIKADPKVKWLQIKGYTDSRGFRNYNDKLGEKRTKALQDYLTSHGVDGVDIGIKSYGERKPIKSNRTTKGRSLNRVALLTLFTKEPPPPAEFPEFEFENIFDNLPGQDPQYKAARPGARVTPESQSESPPPADLIQNPISAPPSEGTEKVLIVPPIQADTATAQQAPQESSAAASNLLFEPITQDMVESGK